MPLELNELGDEQLARIYSFLPTERDKKAFGCTGQRFFKIHQFFKNGVIINNPIMTEHEVLIVGGDQFELEDLVKNYDMSEKDKSKIYTCNTNPRAGADLIYDCHDENPINIGSTNVNISTIVFSHFPTVDFQFDKVLDKLENFINDDTLFIFKGPPRDKNDKLAIEYFLERGFVFVKRPPQLAIDSVGNITGIAVNHSGFVVCKNFESRFENHLEERPYLSSILERCFVGEMKNFRHAEGMTGPQMLCDGVEQVLYKDKWEKIDYSNQAEPTRSSRICAIV